MCCEQVLQGTNVLNLLVLPPIFQWFGVKDLFDIKWLTRELNILTSAYHSE